MSLAEIAPEVSEALTAGTALDHAHDAVNTAGQAANDAILEGVFSTLGLLDD